MASPLQRLWRSLRDLWSGTSVHELLLERFGDGLIWSVQGHAVHFEAPEPGWPAQLRGQIHPRLAASVEVVANAGEEGPHRVVLRRADRSWVLSARGPALAVAEARGAPDRAVEALPGLGERVGTRTIRLTLQRGEDPRQSLSDRLEEVAGLLGLLVPHPEPRRLLEGAPHPGDAGALRRRMVALMDLGADGPAPSQIEALVGSQGADDLRLVLRMAPEPWTDRFAAELSGGFVGPSRHHALALALAEAAPSSVSTKAWAVALRRGSSTARLELALALLASKDKALRALAIDAVPPSLPRCPKNDSRRLLSDAMDALPRREVQRLRRALLPHLGRLHKTFAGRVAAASAEEAGGRVDGPLREAVFASAGINQGPLHPTVAAQLLAGHPADVALDRRLAAKVAGFSPRVQLAVVGRMQHRNPELADALRALLSRRGVARTVVARIRVELEERGHAAGGLALAQDGGGLALTADGGTLATAED